MEVILLERLANLGSLGDTVNVKPGYARNFLVPHGKAVIANNDNRAVFEARRAEFEKQAKETLDGAQGRADKLAALALTVTRKAGEQGKLFGSVGAADIVEAAGEQGVELNRHEVRLADGPLRQVGDYEITVHLHADVDTVLRLTVAEE